MEKVKIKIPSYLENFKCIGTTCPDNCCKNWKVLVEKNAFKRFKNYKGKSDIDIPSGVVRIRKNYSDKAYGFIKMNQGSCTFLDENSLCSVQKTEDHNFLPWVCQIYPRIHKRNTEILEVSATLSCPVISQAALSDPNGIKFKYTFTDENFTQHLEKQFLQEKKQLDIGFFKKNELIREFVIMLLQDRKQSLFERIIIVGIFLDRLESSIDKSYNNTENIIQALLLDIQKESIASNIKQIPIKLDLQLIWLRDIVSLRNKSPLLSDKYAKYYNRFLDGLQLRSDSSQDEKKKNFEDLKSIYSKSFLSKYEYILENYLVNSFFQDFNFDNNKNTYLTSYYRIIILYNLIEFILIGNTDGNNTIDDVTAIDFIQVFTKTMNHNVTYVEDINNLIYDANINSLAHLSILTKR